ncbi:MAG TPA: Spy/CpxP family protein refolding chaperone [Longimicrobiales bacterium]|nr:Spy/CpxP family protein refolding chaperone [Longimicrobiales bacterium]
MSRSLLAGLALALALGMTPALSAQQPQHPRMHDQQGHRQDQGTMMSAAFRGITLTPTQQAQVNRIHERYAAQYNDVRARLRPAAQEMRSARQSGNKKAEHAAFQRMKPQQDRLRSLMRNEMQEFRAVLTPEQQRVFDKNMAAMRSHMQQYMRMGRPYSG